MSAGRVRFRARRRPLVAAEPPLQGRNRAAGLGDPYRPPFAHSLVSGLDWFLIRPADIAREVAVTKHLHTRRGLLVAVSGVALATLGVPHAAAHPCRSATRAGPHPDPRPDVDASRVIPAAELAEDVVELYDGIRRIPHIADGIRCACGCADLEGFRSLLTCFESNGMATHCLICQSEGRLVVRLHETGRSLEQIRRAVDARFG